MPDFSQRSQGTEIMDDLTCSGEVVHQTLRELDAINHLLGGNHVTLDGLSKVISENTEIKVSDLGCGSGDMLRRVRRWSEKKGIKLQLTGVDANRNIIAFAIRATPPQCNISYQAIDIFSEEFRKQNPDVVIATLFFHHFSNEQLVHFFAQLKRQVKIGIVINDIHRHWLAYYSIKMLTRLFSKSAMVKFDAPLSVLRAFKKHELESIIKKAGFENYTIKWMWAFRWQVVVKVNQGAQQS